MRAVHNVTYCTAARYRFIICDESHWLKDDSTQRYNGLAPLLKRAAHAILVTGTPIMNRWVGRRGYPRLPLGAFGGVRSPWPCGRRA